MSILLISFQKKFRCEILPKTVGNCLKNKEEHPGTGDETSKSKKHTALKIRFN